LFFETLIGCDDLHRDLGDQRLIVVDCRHSLADFERGHRDYNAAHIPGAVFADMETDLSGDLVEGRTGRHPLPHIVTFTDTLSHWGIDNSCQVVAYDDAGGAIAARLWWMLRWLGHPHVAVLEGGWPAWCAKNYPTRSGQESNPARCFKAQVRPELLADVDLVAAKGKDAQWCLIDARGAARYRGEIEPIDRVAGHIPGAINLPFAENLDKDGSFLDAKALGERFKSALGEVPIDRTIVYCGSGVTAAHNLLAMVHAGLGDAKCYSGSWSEWIADGTRAIETGPGNA